MLFLLTNFPQKLKLKEISGTLVVLFYVSPSSSQQEFAFFIKNTKKNTLQQATGGNTPILV